VTPKLVGEVAYTQWTPEGRIRHPSWRGLRPGKSPSGVYPAELHEMQHEDGP
jgi:bifunctional non-homologous end joining protein LigD